jgi:tetratricopeptide (TPR) repeat protein
LAISLDVARVSGPLILDSDRPGLAFWPITLVLGLDPGLGAPRIDLAAHHQFRRHPRAALAQLAAVPAGSPAFAAAQLQAAQLLTEQGDPAAALAAADAAVQHGHALPQAQLLRAKALLAQNQLLQAVEAATAGLTATPIDPAVRAALLQARAQARIAGSAPDPGAAIADLRAAMSATPRDPHPRARLVVLLAAAVDPAEAQELLQGVNPRGLTDAALLVGLGRAGLQLGQRDRAMEALQHAARTAPTNAEALEALGDAYLSVGRVQDARLQWQRARSQPDLPPTIVARLTQKLETTQAARGGP